MTSARIENGRADTCRSFDEFHTALSFDHWKSFRKQHDTISERGSGRGAVSACATHSMTVASQAHRSTIATTQSAEISHGELK